jgi:hypothetical protein
MKLQRFGLALVSCLIAGGISGEIALAQATKPANTAPTLHDVMTLVVDPAANGVFQVASQAPKNDAEWKTLQSQALTLYEISKTLTTPGRAKDNKEWMQLAKALQSSSKTAFQAAMKKDAKVLGDLSDALYQTCADCHEKYIPKK